MSLNKSFLHYTVRTTLMSSFLSALYVTKKKKKKKKRKRKRKKTVIENCLHFHNTQTHCLQWRRPRSTLGRSSLNASLLTTTAFAITNAAIDYFNIESDSRIRAVKKAISFFDRFGLLTTTGSVVRPQHTLV